MRLSFLKPKYKLFFFKKFYYSMESNRKWTHPLENLKDNKAVYRTGLHVYNSLTKQKEEFVTKDGTKNLTWYMCGPTVYDAAHLGHARTYVCFDIIRRILTTYFGYEVYLTMNVTDIDDKIILRSNEQGREFREFAKFWEDDYFKDMRNLNVLYPNNITRVSEYIPEIIEFITKLISKGYAYATLSGVYFNIDEFMKNNVKDF
jgi:cysteinyl-tRNA synthetase